MPSTEPLSSDFLIFWEAINDHTKRGIPVSKAKAIWEASDGDISKAKEILTKMLTDCKGMGFKEALREARKKYKRKYPLAYEVQQLTS